MNIDKKISDIIALPEADRVAAMKKCAKQTFINGMWVGFAITAVIATISNLLFFEFKKKK